jgi:hypothetical protein
MPGNKELIQQAKSLAKKLGREVRFDGLNNPQLVELVDDLEEQVELLEEPPTEAPNEAPVKVTDPGPTELEDLSVPDEVRDPVNGAGVPPLGGPPLQARSVAPLARPKVVVAFEYQVAPGKSIACVKGIVDQNQEIRVKDISGGQEALDHLVAKGHVLKR